MGHLEQKMGQLMSPSAITLPVQHVYLCPDPPQLPTLWSSLPFLIHIHVHLTFPSASIPSQHFMSRLNILNILRASGNSLGQGTKDGSFTVHLR